MMEKLFPNKKISKTDFSGILLIEGDLKKNCIQFSFIFDKKEMVHPLVICANISPLEHGQNYQEEFSVRYLCNVRDLNNPIIKTGIIYLDFLIIDHRFLINDVISQLSCAV